MISYEPLFQTMKEKHISSYGLEKRGFPHSTYYAIKHGKGITTNSINQLCSILRCSVSDVVEYIEDSQEPSFEKKVTKIIYTACSHFATRCRKVKAAVYLKISPLYALSLQDVP